MANYIQTLQQTVAEQATVIEQLADWRTACQIMLQLNKFNGVDADGTRKDWIATGDVSRLLESMPFDFNAEG